MAMTPGVAQSVAVEVRSEGVDGFTGQMGNAVGALKSFRGAVGLAGGALVALAAGGMAASINAAREFEEAMVEVEKVTDPETALALAGGMRELATEIPLAQSELAGLAADAARFGIRGTENIEAFTESAAKMAIATDLSADEAGRAFAKLANITQTPVEEIENLGSSINALSNNFATSSSEIVDNMLRSSAALSQLGLSATDIAGLAAAINQTSESAERAGTRMRRLAQELMRPDQVRELGSALLNAGEMTRFLGDEGQALVSTFRDTETSVRVANEALVAEQSELRALQDEVHGTTAALEGMGDEHDELGDTIEDNRIQIQEIRLAARKEGRELTDAEKKQIEELRLANDELRLEQAKLGREMDETREKREEQVDAVEAQEQAVEAAREKVESEAAAQNEAEQAVLERFRAMIKENPQGAILELAEAMNEGGDAAAVLNTEMTSVSSQALAALGTNVDDVREAMAMGSEEFRRNDSLQREFAAAVDTTNSKATLARNRLRNLAITTGNRLLPAVNELIGGFGDMLEPMTELQAKTDGMAGVWGLLGLAIAGVALVVASFLGGPGLALLGFAALLAAAWQDDFANIREHWDRIVTGLREVWEMHAGPLMDEVEAWVAIFKDTWRTIRPVVEPIVNALIDIFGTSLVGSFDAVLTALTAVSQFLRGDFEGAWDTVLGGLMRNIRRVLDLLDRLSGGLSSDLLGQAGDALGGGGGGGGGGPLGNIRIPSLATGGVALRETVAHIGESGPEAVIPLDRLGEMVGTAGLRGQVEVVLRVEGSGVLADLIREMVNAEVSGRMARERARADDLSGRPGNV